MRVGSEVRKAGRVGKIASDRTNDVSTRARKRKAKKQDKGRGFQSSCGQEEPLSLTQRANEGDETA